MTTATIVPVALAKEKVWFDKPSYDKAERQYFEKMAKVVSRKIAEGCTLKSDNSITDKCQDLINTNTLKSKAEKSKDNKLAHESNETNMKRSKCQGKNAKLINKDIADVCNMQNKESAKTCEKFNSERDNTKEKENASTSEKSKEYNAKEAKEKKNKEDTRNKNRGNEGNDLGGNKETAVPFTRNKEQMPDQGAQQSTCPLPPVGSLANEVAKARQHIKQSLQCMDDIAALAHTANQDINPRIVKLEKENQDLQNIIQDLKSTVEKLTHQVKIVGTLEDRVGSLEARIPYIAICPAKPEEPEEQKQNKKKDDNEDIDLFGSDSEGDDLEAAKIREERIAAYTAKKSKKPALIAKSNIVLDVKPWDDETDMQEMEKEVRKIEIDGLLWGASKLMPLAFGIHKLQISCVVEDDKVSVDWLMEQIQDIEEYVQSVDIAAFNKV
ncbi:PREDICTED: elongation factor 1-delta-like isoform X1 [Cyphomyrmex costatus]|uniref:elongation factor 1-delta-like isoform X1 n=1 Tax=Cyphomyrmex costatus TaxID=456900 RepID=UPI0008524391|nr:PREDICTED: elongation factor 1-delta-like isoform X1 [Cyphomyrmex costatus]XP_018404957.1 PREDICTED: elongation factor 1-delta-like isoform X1 [Cyphomyrmex costatus]